MEIKINDISYWVKIYRQDESKPCLIMLHGFMGSGRVFDTLISSLKPFCNPVTVDLLGHGKTEAATSPERFQTQKQIEDLAAIIQKITDEPIFLYGYSMGGRMALQLAAAKPDLLKGLILESTNPGLKNQQERYERKQLDKQRAQKIESSFNKFLEEWKQLPLFKNTTASEADLEKYRQIQQQQNPRQIAFSLRGFGTGRMPTVNLKEIKTTTLLIAGEEDEKYVQIMKRMHQQLSSSKFKIISGAGHRVHIDNPAALEKSISPFIK